MLKYVNLQKFPKPLFRHPFPPWYFHQPIGSIVSQYITEYYTENFDGVLGFRAEICEICLTSRTVPAVEQRLRDQIKDEQTCNPDIINEIQNLDTAHKQKLFIQMKQKFPMLLFRRCKEWAKDEVYLHAYQLTKEHILSKNIDIAKINKRSWIIRAINESQIFLEDSELLDFLQMSHDQTAIFLTTFNSLEAEQPSYYLLVVRRYISLYMPPFKLSI